MKKWFIAGRSTIAEEKEVIEQRGCHRLVATQPCEALEDVDGVFDECNAVPFESSGVFHEGKNHTHVLVAGGGFGAKAELANADRCPQYSDFCGLSFAFDHRLKVAQQMSPAELMTMIVQLVLCEPLKLGLNCLCTTDFQSVGGNLMSTDWKSVVPEN